MTPDFLANAVHGVSDAVRHMEIWGMGPELWADRAIAWVKAVGAVLSEAISQLGTTTAAVILFVQNISYRRKFKARIDRNAKKINQVALAQTPRNKVRKSPKRK